MRLRLPVLLHVLCLALATREAFGQSCTITSPASNTTVKEGDDYFTDVRNDPIDFDRRRDFMWDELYVDPGVTASGGVWTGTTRGSAYLYPLHMGYAGIVNPAIWGITTPIVTSKYTALSGLSTMNSAAARTVRLFRWSRDINPPDLTGASGLLVQRDDVFFTNTTVIRPPANLYEMDNFDLSTNAAWTGGNVTGLVYDQSVAAPVGTVESYRWVRAYDPASAPTVNINWNFAGLPLLAGGAVTPKANIYVDSDAVGFDGFFLDRVNVNNGTASGIITGNGTYALKTAALPPGNYFFYVVITDAFETTDDVLATSGYSARLTVNAKPRLTFSNPSYISGEDYATAVLGNPWDMSDASDVQNFSFDPSLRQWKNPVFSSFFRATAYLPPGQTESDAQVWLNTDLGTTTRKINPARYHYATYRFAMDPAGYGDLRDKVDRGWVVRLVWWDVNPFVDGSVTSDIVTFDDARDYSIDLNSVPLAPAAPGNTRLGWQGTPSRRIAGFRFDPCEVSFDTNFDLDDVKLTADPEALTGSFNVTFDPVNREGDSVQVDLFYDNDRAGFDGTLIGSALFLASPGQSMTWNTAAVANGAYYLYAIASDAAGNSFRRYADVPVIVNNPVPVTRYRLYNPNTGDHHYTTSLLEYNTLPIVGWVQEGGAYSLYSGPATIGGVTAQAYLRLYNPSTGWHHWTTAVGEYTALSTIGWIQEGPDGFIFGSPTTGTTPLYRLYNPFSGFHHWTIFDGEYASLATLGWIQEGVAGHVINGPSPLHDSDGLRAAGEKWLETEYPGLLGSVPRTDLRRASRGGRVRDPGGPDTPVVVRDGQP